MVGVARSRWRQACRRLVGGRVGARETPEGVCGCGTGRADDDSQRNGGVGVEERRVLGQEIQVLREGPPEGRLQRGARLRGGEHRFDIRQQFGGSRGFSTGLELHHDLNAVLVERQRLVQCRHLSAAWRTQSLELVRRAMREPQGAAADFALHAGELGGSGGALLLPTSCQEAGQPGESEAAPEAPL